MNVSVIIPTYNRKPILEKCLNALEKQTLTNIIRNYEIVVVDDGSTDGTPSWIRKNSDIFPHVVLYEQEHGGPALGRNLGVIKSKYEIIIFIDSDLIVLENFIVCHVNKLLVNWNKNNNELFTFLFLSRMLYNKGLDELKCASLELYSERYDVLHFK